jgi:hypothetical protein
MAPWSRTRTWAGRAGTTSCDGRGNAYVNGAGFNPMAGEEFRPGSVHLVTADGSVRRWPTTSRSPTG